MSLQNKPSGVRTVVADNSVLDMATPVIHNNKVLGWARIGISQRHINNNMLRIVRNGIILMILGLVIGTIVAVSVSNKLNQGLYSLIATTDKIRGGDRKVRVAHFRSYEISKLATSFNQMVDEVSAHERLLEMVLQNLAVGVFIMDKHGNINSANAAASQMWNDIRLVGQEEYGNYRAWFTDTKELLKPKDWGAAIALRTGEAVLEQELEIEAFDGKRKIILNSAIPLKNDSREIIGAIAINVNITERKHAEAELIKMNHNIAERVKELTSLYSISRLANNQEMSVEEMLQACVELIPPAYQFSEIASARITYKQKEYMSIGFSISEWRQAATIKSMVDAGSVGTVEVYYAKEMPHDHEGPFLLEERLLINSIADILSTTIQNRIAELKLRQNEEKFRSLVEQTLAGVFIVQQEKFVYANPKFEKIFGYTAAELTGQPSFLNILHDEDRKYVKAIYQLRLSGKKTNEQYIAKGITKDNKIIYLEMIVSTIIYDEQQAVIGTVVDITDRMEEERRIRKAVNDAQEKERFKIGMELHDNVKQIIAASMINLDYVKLNLGNQEAASQILVKVNGYLRESIDELRRISHQLAPSMDDTLSLKEKVKALISSMNISRKLEVSFDIEEEWKDITNDLQLTFYRIVQEHFANIIKYANATAASIDIKHSDGYLVMHITDKGVGFDTTAKRRGIGLENIKRRAQVFSGDIKITSAPGKGCHLRVSVPA